MYISIVIKLFITNLTRKNKREYPAQYPQVRFANVLGRYPRELKNVKHYDDLVFTQS